MRVLAVVNWLVAGGIETQLLRTIPCAKRLGIEYDICCMGPRRELDEEFEQLGCRIYRIPKSANCFSTAKQFRRVLASRPYDLVHSNFGDTSGGIALATARTQIPLMVSIHNCGTVSLFRWKNRPLLGSIRKGWLNWHRRLMDKHVDMFVGHSETNITAYEPRWRSNEYRYRVILNGITFPKRQMSKSEARRYLALEPSVPLLLHVGSFSEKKNHDGLLRVFRRVLNEYPRAKLVLVGDGALRHRLERKIRDLGMCENVLLQGIQRDVWPYYSAADVFVFPSHVEGFGNVLVESEVCGLPIVASDIPAHRESIAPAQHEFLFELPDYDHAAQLVKRQLDASKVGANHWVAESKRFATENFSIERYTSELAGFYCELTGRAKTCHVGKSSAPLVSQQLSS